MERISLKNRASFRILASLKSYIANEWPFLVSFCFLFASVILWVCLDHCVPTWDSAGYLLRTYTLIDQLNACVSLEKKIALLFTFSPWYPPLFNWVHCLFVVSSLPFTVADNLPRLVFFAIGAISLYKLGRQLFNDAAVGILAMSIFCMLPIVCAVTHSRGLLDMPLASMCFLSFWLLARWQAAPSLAKSLAAGCAIGLTCLTKQMGVVYLAPAILLVVIQRLLARDFGKLVQLSCGLCLAALLFLSWLLPALKTTIIRASQAYDKAQSPEASGFAHWFHHVNLYLQDESYNISMPVSLLFLISLFNFAGQRKLWLPSSTLLSFFVLCSLRSINSEGRYILPVLGYVSLSVAALLVRLWRSGSLLPKVSVVAFVLYLLTIYFVLNFTPYPFAWATALQGLKTRFNGNASYWTGVIPAQPDPSGPNAYKWLFDQLQFAHLDHQDLLMGVNCLYCEPLAIQYLARQRGMSGLALRGLTSSQLPWKQQCNALRVELNPDWYLTTTNAETVGAIFYVSAQDLESYIELRKYFETSGSFTKVGQCRLPDGRASMVLYRKQNSPPTSGN